MTGPDTGGPPSGPGITIPRLPFPKVSITPELAARLRREAAAHRAGGQGVSTVPLTAEQREERYRWQTGTRRTARQRRRIEHKTRRSLAGRV
ncbi:hypothetical protein C1I95_32485 [Micromonospora craterilacus]|uniref:Uncharacterized protein n=1 Tax=Micromonospora craterilacus TaxID=1655439 RepID=A0A2W2D6G3_9ACTN|nr:hypothetical protein [Micromonospora craterilacus]PZG05801.1 hypothetical protein C1I95_32485 [Micromonospora craterilacus]